jgi:hypothetical protein
VIVISLPRKHDDTPVATLKGPKAKAEPVKNSRRAGPADPSPPATDRAAPGLDDVGFQKWAEQVANLPALEQVYSVAKKLQESNAGFDGNVAHKIENGAVTEFTLCCDNVSDISPVRALRELKRLSCTGSAPNQGQLSELSSLAGMKLTHLWFANTRVADLTPLRGMPLVHLDFYAAPVSDLAPIKDMALTGLQCYDTRVTDLSPLAGMPLKGMFCNFTLERDTQLLRSLKALETINGKPVAESWRAALSNLGPLSPAAAKAHRLIAGWVLERGGRATIVEGGRETIHVAATGLPEGPFRVIMVDYPGAAANLEGPDMFGRFVGVWDVATVTAPCEYQPNGGTQDWSEKVECILGRNVLWGEPLEAAPERFVRVWIYDRPKRAIRSWYIDEGGGATASSAPVERDTASLVFSASESDSISTRITHRFADADHSEWRLLMHDKAGKLLLDRSGDCMRRSGAIR